jgi:hypothetical protein
MNSFSRKPSYNLYALAGMLALITIMLTLSPVYLDDVDDISVLLGKLMSNYLR